MQSRLLRLCRFSGIVGLFFIGANVMAGGVTLDREPEIGERIRVPAGAELTHCMVSPGQIDKCFKVDIDEVEFTIAYRRRSRSRGSVVTYMHTNDARYCSKDGYRVGDAITISSLDRIVSAPGFEVYANDESGWIPVVGFSGEVTEVDAENREHRVSLKSINRVNTTALRLRIVGFTKR